MSQYFQIFSKKMRDAAAAHLRHIASEKGDEALKPRDFAIAAYVEFLEDKSKRLRRASLIALGKLFKMCSNLNCKNQVF